MNDYPNQMGGRPYGGHIHPQTCGDNMRMATPFFDTIVNKENQGMFQPPGMHSMHGPSHNDRFH